MLIRKAVSTVLLVLVLPLQLMAESPGGTRIHPWTTSRVTGSPDPPLPYKTSRVFKSLKIQNPTDVVWAPEADRWVVTQLNAKLFAFKNDTADGHAEEILSIPDLPQGGNGRAYGTLFHPDQANHPWCFLTFTQTPQDLRGTVLARIRVLDPTVPTFDPDSLTVMAAWNSEGHSGGAMQFGPDGMLYVSVGDGQNPYPPDRLNVGQNLNTFESTILRIDVDHVGPGQTYRVPDSNPFVDRKGARPEIWAYGFRNPWKIAFDPASGDLFAGDVGWEMREMIYRVKRGGNYGWSTMEGSQPVKQEQTPDLAITPPLFEHTHVDSRSITGGYFWNSERLPELKGAYIYGDWMTGKVWALKHEGDQVLWQKELVDTPLQIICFMSDPSGEVFVVGYDGTILRLETNEVVEQKTRFPERLSETGLFASLDELRPADGVTEYQISAHHWADGTHSRQWIAVPGAEQLGIYQRSDWQTGQTEGRFDFPVDTVLAKTVSYFEDTSDPTSERHLETQLLHRQGDEWRAYNYVWTEDQSDAQLQADLATETRLTIRDERVPGGRRIQTWRHASRSECLLCHIWAAGTVHAFADDQLNINVLGESQLERLTRLGLFGTQVPVKTPLASVDDSERSIEDRARSYLAMNCATCHRPQGGGTANFNFDITKSLEENNYIGEKPAQGSFGLPDARVVAPGDPCRSVLIYRTLKAGRGHMPQFGSNVIDLTGVKLLSDWIAAMPSSESRGTVSATATRSVKDSGFWVRDAKQLLDSTSGAIALSLACGELAPEDLGRARLIKMGMQSESPEIRDLFEHYLPEDQRVKRLGATIDEAALMAIEGSAERGQALFETAKEFNCRSCHQIGSVGKQVGPGLNGIGLKLKPAEILAGLVRPSEKIAPEYRTRQVLTTDGSLVVGIVIKENDAEIHLADSAGKIHEIDQEDVDAIRPSAVSVMPEQLLSGMTPQQAADLIAFLSAQKTAPSTGEETGVDQPIEESRD